MDGDAVARFEDLFHQHFDAVLRYALARIEPDTARDIAAEVFLVAWRRFDDVPDPAIGWLIAVTRNKVVDQYRASGRRDALAAALQFEPSDESADDHADAIATRAVVRTAFRRLSTDDQEVLRLVAWDDLDRAAAAQALGCSPGLFAVRLHRARRRLRHLLDDTDPAAHPAPNPIVEALR